MAKSTNAFFPLVLLLVAVFMCASPSEAASRIVPNDGPGVFFIFASGQVLILDPITRQLVRQMKNFSEPEFPQGVPLPNFCPGSPFLGMWNKATLGVGAATIFATAMYQTTNTRPVNLSDAIYVINGPSGPIVERVKSPGQPNNIYYIPYANSIWAHNDVDGSFSVIQASSPFTPNNKTVSNNLTVVQGYGELLYDDAFNGAAYKTTVDTLGLYLYYDVFRPQISIDSLPFIQLNGMMLGNKTIRCASTKSAAYSRNLRSIFVACGEKRFSPAGIVEFNPRDGSILSYYNFTADTLVVVPSEDFLIGINGAEARLYLIRLSGSSSEAYGYVPLPKYSYPSEVVFYESGNNYKMYISLANDTRMASLSISQVNCGLIPCKPDNLFTFLNFFEVGAHGLGPVDSSGTFHRSIAAGWNFICTVSYSSSAISCYDTTTSLQSGLTGVYNITGIDNPQLIVYVKGLYSGERATNIDARLNCSAVPLNLTSAKSDAPLKAIINTNFAFLIAICYIALTLLA